MAFKALKLNLVKVYSSRFEISPFTRFVLVVQLLNCYYEAYQHAAGTEERFALVQVITDITHCRPQLDLNLDYFVQVYRAEIGCLQSHQQLIRDILDTQVKILFEPDMKRKSICNHFDNQFIVLKQK